jgi:hypothetical protein
MNTTTIIFLLVLVGSIVAYYKLKSGEVLRFETTSTPRQVTMTAVGVVATKRRWATLSQGDGSANFNYARGANKLVLVIGFLFFIVPGIVYWILSGKKESLSVNTEEIGSGMTVVQITSNGWRGKSAGQAVRAQLGLAPGTAASIVQAENTARVAPGATSLVEQGHPAAGELVVQSEDPRPPAG